MERGKRTGTYRIYSILALAMLVNSCDKEVYQAPEEQPVYFEYHFANYAWGYQNHGWLVDAEGTIRRFEFPESYNQGGHGDYLTLEQLEANLGQADSVIGEVGTRKLEKQIGLIQGAADGQITKIHRQGADMGLGVYSCFKYDPEQKAYQIILLFADGDCQQYNKSTDAEKLTEWLKDLL